MKNTELELRNGMITFSSKSGSLVIRTSTGSGWNDFTETEFSTEDVKEIQKFLGSKTICINKLTEEQIADINEWVRKSKNYEGGYVYDIYQSINSEEIKIDMTTSGYQGGSCWGGKARPFDNNVSLDDITILDKTLERLVPNISSEQCRKIFYLLQTECPSVENTERESYGDSIDTIKWNIPLETLYKVVSEIL
jgi:hypothetical protein